MSSLRTPTGPLPRSVYWRRRMVLLLGLAALVTIVVLVVVRPGSARSDGQNGPPPAASTSTVTGAPSNGPSASGTPGPSGSPACKPSNVKVVPVTDANRYASGSQPQLSMSITNGGSSPCSFDVGTGAQLYTITSGSERIWSSRDCQTGPTQDVQTLQPGKTLTTQPFAWDRTRSSTSTCAGTRPPVIAGGASYHLAVALGAAKSSTTKQFILN